MARILGQSPRREGTSIALSEKKMAYKAGLSRLEEEERQ